METVTPTVLFRGRQAVWLAVLVALSVLLAACSPGVAGAPIAQSQAAEQTSIPVVGKQNPDQVVAEGSVQPARTARLSFEIPGDVVEVRVEKEDYVEAGTLLVRLDTRELELSLRSAEQDLVAQRAALAQLVKGASEKVIARADKATADQIDQARVALEAKKLQLSKARAEDPSIAVAAAQARVRQLELQLAQAQARDPGPTLTGAEVALERARIALEDAQDEYNKALDRPWEDQAIRDAWAKRLEQAQLDYKSAQAQVDGAINARRAHQVGLSIIAAQIEEAKAQLAQAITAQETYSTTLDVLATAVKAAQLQLAALESTDNPYRDKASPEEIAQFQVRVQKAEIAVQTLRLKLEDAELSAPFGGTVVDVSVKVGDRVNPNQVVVTLATLDRLEIHTTDLTELDVVKIAVGDPVAISADALPQHTFTGTLAEIDLEGKDYRGDVVYQVIIGLDGDQDLDALRWGMTVMVEIGPP